VITIEKVKYLTFLILLLSIFTSSTILSKNYAVLFSAGNTNADDTQDNSEYWYDLFTTYKSLYENGFDHNSIYVLYGDGVDFVSSVDSFKVPSRWNRSNITDYSNTPSNLQSVLSSLGGTMTSNDNLYFWWTGHGLMEGGYQEVKFWIANRGIYVFDHDLAGYINQISNYNKRYISIMTCYSGGIIDDLNNNSTIIHTSSPWNQPTVKDEFEGHPHAGFSYYLASALNWRTPIGTAISADRNADGLVNLDEAFIYMQMYDNYLNDQQSSDPGGIDDNYYTFCAGPIIRNTNIKDNFVFNGNVTINSGKTLTFSQNTTATFLNGSSLIVNGTLTANGSSADNSRTFDFISPDSTTENGIKFNSGSSGTVNYCKVQNAYRGIYENSESVDITNSVLSYCTYGIYLYSSHPTISQNNIHHNSYAGIYLVSSPPSTAYSVIIKNNYIKNNSQYGVYCTTSSNPQIGNVNNTYGNAIENNYYGVFCWNNSIPKIGNYPLSEGGYNNIINNTYSVYNMSSSSVSAMYNWWGSTVPSNFGIAGTGGVGTSYYLSSSATIDPYPTLSKTASNYYISGVSDIPLFSELNKANQLVASNNLTEAREVCLNLIKNFPDYSVSYNALNLLKETYTADDISGKKNIYKSLFNSKEKKDIYAMAGLILADIDKENRLKQIEEVISNYAGESIVELALFDKFIYYYFELNDKENSRAVSNELDGLFPLSQGAIEAHRILGDKEYFNIFPEEKSFKKTATSTIPTEYSLSDNYPNPFNPTTIINFQIPEDGFVTLKVYDILGREVASLVNADKKAGYYSCDFDASKLSSGVYIYKITANNFIQSKKMLMIK
jgi:hypothetical protein